MPHAHFRFYEELNDFLPPGRRKVTFVHAWKGTASVKDIVESLGVPHTEVDLILANGESVDFAYRPKDGDRISVYPMFESFDISPAQRLRPRPLREPRFVLDGHLGRLARYLRMLGFDTLWSNDADDEKLAHISQQQTRTLLTRDQGLLKRKDVTRGYWVRSTAPREQLREVLERFDLYRAATPFTRCMACNGLLRSATLEEVKERLPPRTALYYHEFWQCERCAKVYWEGPHVRRMEKLLQEVLGSSAVA
ncbi:MAG TPA: Mut7-C RNAse domain-containing protein [Anaerolineae bacterium]|nr:Mut7-C RNAse domain-containing protein [Anaerolineae bacterium]